MQSKSRLILCILTFLALSAAAGAVRLTDVEVSDDPVDYKNEFSVEAKFSGDTCNTQAWFFIDDFRFATKNLQCDADELTVEFDLDEGDWDLHGIKCGPHEARVELYGSGTLSLLDNRSTDFGIGTLPNLEFFPSRPLAEKEVRVTLKDPDSGNPLKQVDVKIRDQYGGDELSKRTSSDGSFVFKPDVAGEYRMIVDERDFCGEIIFYIKRPLLVDGPRPENPVVDEMVLVAVPSGSTVGVKVLDANGSVYQTVPVSYNGGANFSIHEPGEYTLVIGDLSTKYWGINKSMTVTERPIPEVKVAPDEPIVGKPMTFTVTSRGQALSDATLTIKKPDGVAREFTTNSYGIVNYDSVSSTGEYEVSVTKDRHGSASTMFEAYHAFDVVVEPALSTVKDTITLTVNDQAGATVGDALIEVPGIDFMRVCDMAGKISFNLQEPKEYTIHLSKNLFWNKSLKVTPYGILSVESSVSELQLNQDVTVTVSDSFGNPTTADMRFMDPDGVVRYYSAESHTLKPDKPGRYVVVVDKTNYLGVNTTFTVKPHPLQVSSTLVAGQLMVNVSSEGQGVADLMVSLSLGDVVLNESTNDDGMAYFDVRREGNITLTVNPAGYDRVYEEKVLRQSVVRSYRLEYLVAPLVVIFVITVLTVAAIQLGRRYLGVEWTTPKTVAKKKGKMKAKGKHESVLMADKTEKKRSSRLSDL